MEILGSSKISLDGTNEVYNVSRSRVMRCYRYDVHITGTWLNETSAHSLWYMAACIQMCVLKIDIAMLVVLLGTMCNGHCAVSHRRCTVFHRLNSTHT